MVYQMKYNATDEDIYGSIIRWFGGVVSDGFPIDTSGLVESDPSVSSVTDEVSGARRWMVVYQKLNPNSPPFAPPEHDIWGSLWTDSSFITAANLSTLLGASGPHDQTHPSVDTDGTRFAVGFTDTGGFVDIGTPYLATVHVSSVPFTSFGVTEYPVPLNTYNGLDDHVQITSKRSGGGVQYRYMSVHDVESLNVNGNSEAIGVLYDGWSAAASGAYINYVHPGCGGLTLSVTGFPALGLGVTATLNGVQGTGYIGYGAPMSPISLCTGCLLGIDPATATIYPATSLSGTVPLDGAFVNVVISIQGADIGSNGGCPGAPPVRLSDVVTVTIL